MSATESQLGGCLLGMAIGDAIGLPYEGLSRRRAATMLGAPDRHRFVFGRGMVSDDTEHACMTAQALVVSRGNVDTFQRSLAWRLRWWLLALPAGVGLGTARAILKLWCGFHPDRSGVFSAGNGPAMRAPIIGAAIDDLNTLKHFAAASTRLTHSDPRAEYGAHAIAIAARMAAHAPDVDADAYLASITEQLPAEASELITLLTHACESANARQSTLQFAAAIGLDRGVSGYMYHTVPVVIHAWLMHPHDVRQAIMAVIECGGDTDTTAAIVGGIVGASVRTDGLPEDWLDALAEWPRSRSWMTRLATQLAGVSSVESAHGPQRALSTPYWGIVPRNLIFLAIVLFHGFRRLLPPYWG